MAFTQAEIEERKLEHEIMKNPQAVENGLVPLDHQVPAGTGKIDILAVDSGGIFTILELKVNEDDSALMQILEYYDWVNQNIDRLAERYREKNHKITIDKESSPRIILIAPSYSQTLKTSSRYIDAKIDLFEYMYLQSKGGEKGLFCRNVELQPPASPPTKPMEVSDHVEYITNSAAKQLCKEVMDKIQKISRDIEVSPTQWALSFKYANRVIAYVSTRRNFFHIQYPKRGRNWTWVEIEKKRDFVPDILEGIEDFYDKLKGE